MTAASDTPTATASPVPKFTVGSTMRHVAVMTGTSLLGLAAIFVVDFLNLFYISLLKNEAFTAAVGYAGALLFLLISVGIGTAIAGTALTARAIGARRMDEARQIAASSLTLAFIAMLIPAIAMAIFAPQILAAMGATDEALTVGTHFLRIVLPGMPFMGIGMMLGGVLRAVGDARRAMYVTLAGAISTAILDPVFIFSLDLGVTGAAIVTNISRLVFVIVGLNGAARVHHLLAWPSLRRFLADFQPLMVICIPAVLTNLATPAGAIVTTRIVADYGNSAVAGWAVMDRLVPLAFGGVFALTGAIGPILGQNLGARRHDRLRSTVTDSVKLTVFYCLAVWGLLALLAPFLVRQFHLTGDGAVALAAFCHWGAGTFVFTGLMFVANAVFNNLGAPVYSTLFNWGRATLGTVPFVILGARWFGVEGIVGGWGFSAVFFGLGALYVCFKVLDRVEARAKAAEAPAPAN